MWAFKSKASPDPTPASKGEEPTDDVFSWSLTGSSGRGADQGNGSDSASLSGGAAMKQLQNQLSALQQERNDLLKDVEALCMQVSCSPAYTLLGYTIHYAYTLKTFPIGQSSCGVATSNRFKNPFDDGISSHAESETDPPFALITARV